MKKLTNQSFLLILLLCIVAVLGLSNYNAYHKLGASLNDIKDYKFKYELYKDSLGRVHAVYKIDPHYSTQLNPSDALLVDAEAKSQGLSRKDMKRVTQVSTSTTAPIFIPIHTPSFDDGHLSLNIKSDSNALIGTYTYKDTAWFDTYNKPKKFLGIVYKQDVYGNVHFGNPNTIITGLNDISIKDYTTPKHWVLGPTAGITYINGLHPYIGIGVTYKLIQW